jgi:hypothetical protein
MSDETKVISLLAVSLFCGGQLLSKRQIRTGAASELQGWMRGRASIVFVFSVWLVVDIIFYFSTYNHNIM